MRKFGSILAIVGIFSIIMTGVRLYNAGFPLLEGPEGETWAGVLQILAPYAVMLLISLGVAGLEVTWRTALSPQRRRWRRMNV